MYRPGESLVLGGLLKGLPALRLWPSSINHDALICLRQGSQTQYCSRCAWRISSHQCNNVVCARVHEFACIKTIECNSGVSSSVGCACSSWNFVKRYDLVALSKIHVCNDLVATDARIYAVHRIRWAVLFYTLLFLLCDKD